MLLPQVDVVRSNQNAIAIVEPTYERSMLPNPIEAATGVASDMIGKVIVEDMRCTRCPSTLEKVTGNALKLIELVA